MNIDIRKKRSKKLFFKQLLEEGLTMPEYKDLTNPDKETLLNICINSYFPNKKGYDKLKRLILQYWIDDLKIDLIKLYDEVKTA